MWKMGRNWGCSPVAVWFGPCSTLQNWSLYKEIADNLLAAVTQRGIALGEVAITLCKACTPQMDECGTHTVCWAAQQVQACLARLEGDSGGDSWAFVALTLVSALMFQTLSVSMLLRYSHHQIFVFIGKDFGGV